MLSKYKTFVSYILLDIDAEMIKQYIVIKSCYLYLLFKKFGYSLFDILVFGSFLNVSIKYYIQCI